MSGSPSAIDANVVTFSIKNPEAMRALGAIIGSEILLPFARQNRPVVLDVFGHEACGKTACYNAVHAASMDSGLVSETVFHWCDFGKKGTYPSRSKGDYHIEGNFGVPVVDKNLPHKGFYYYEHPSLPHIHNVGDIGLVISAPALDQHFYFHALAPYIAAYAKQTGAFDLPVQRITAQMLAAMNDPCRHEKKSKTERIVRLFPLNDMEPVRRAFSSAARKINTTFEAYSL